MRTLPTCLSTWLPALGLAAALAAAPLTAVHAASFVVDFSNIDSVDERGAADNVTLGFTLGAGAFVTGFSWDVEVTAHAPSWLSELTLDFGNSSGEGVVFSPAGDVDAPGSFSSAGHLDLLNSGLAFRLRPDGRLLLEFHDWYDDAPGLADGRWNTGTLRFDYVAAVPEPASYAMFALGLLAVGAARLRRRATTTH